MKESSLHPDWRAPKHTREAARQLRKHMTPAEEILWQRLRRNQLGWHFRRQHPLGTFIVDFYCAKARLIIEVDGPIHNKQVEYDREREAWLESHKGHRVIRFTNEEVMHDLEGVLAKIRKALEQTS